MHASQGTGSRYAGEAVSIRTQAGLAVRLEPRGPGAATLVVTGRLDAAGAALVGAMLGHCTEHRARVRVCVDLSGVDEMDAYGVRALMTARQAFRARGGSVTMTGLGVPVAHAEASF